ncbi:hypothetical protein JJJ17_05530 [Paracoccus caeni]|uniref:Uncharacterized protein n=1 Tax=Paracoccus caeni TaxID=657651 RepID=A0A934SJ41_9RHOB|nr:hypothetical protein [Paracoccus caeni]MBK4215383.1 hypothetical protein [Paracoccus caeni]
MTALARKGAVHMAGAFVMMGGWAVFANSAHPMPLPLLAGLVQGTISALITLFLKRMIEAVSRRLSGLAALLVPPLLAFCLSLVLLSILHSLAGTPEIAATIAVPLIVSTSYAALYSYALWRS